MSLGMISRRLRRLDVPRLQIFSKMSLSLEGKTFNFVRFGRPPKGFFFGPSRSLVIFFSKGLWQNLRGDFQACTGGSRQRFRTRFGVDIEIGPKENMLYRRP